MASSAPRSILRPAARLALPHAHIPRRSAGIRALATTPALRVREPPAAPPGGGGEAGMGVGELEGAKFRVEPLRRVGEDDKTMRARLTYQSRKRGTLESDLLLSTFADAYLPTMVREQMAQYDLFLDENDWDIYYWATQEPPSPSGSPGSATTTTTTTSSATTADTAAAAAAAKGATTSVDARDSSDAGYGSGAEAALAEEASGPTAAAAAATTSTGGIEHTGDSGADKEAPITSSSSSTDADAASATEPYREQGEGGSIEWAQTVGTFKPAYRPVPARWRDSEVLRLLREHVRKRAAQRGGMAFMPELRHQD
ncbi:hypothetical protein DL766_000087 [Monosporascus sp. MC13-8B]|uniref:Succinate dehydrogenase assembly factor 2, mitochondrial n=1 Tax=Monosporascus cannonballus TaxID=155416 RepID=A0ABY0GWT9_9PEZI|nr:hypothetical protein DL762_008317 [Monosporascus cannonballus]RYO80265.1 hypothetical protein DL763_008973 [Monosporascus cannonballus]RYP40063.1 hypothetical protein DL766_000087 [Monosporascus sp. MC13-8B]